MRKCAVELSDARQRPTSMKTIYELLRQTMTEWSEDKVPRLGAALAFYSVFAIAPLLLIVIAIAGFVFGRDAAQRQIVGQIAGVVGQESGQAIDKILEQASQPASGTFAIVSGVVVLLFGASGVFAQLQDSLNTIWEVAPKPGRGWKGVLRDRFLSLSMVLGIGFLLLVSLVVSAGLSAMTGLLGDSVSELIGHVINVVVSLAVITVLFAMIYKFLPDVKIAWRDVWLGAAATSALFVVGKLLVGLYLGRSSAASAYGAASSFVLILLWVYYSSQILLFGAEFTQVYANRFGSRIEPARGAVPLTAEAQAQQGAPSTTMRA
ncbi:MAG: YihY/virulence factor BrkB family protein [Planctomycetaceae bacterium]|nr:YihY/virulence factor BrkB family protein [Planctomycetaceae bacterium]